MGRLDRPPRCASDVYRLIREPAARQAFSGEARTRMRNYVTHAGQRGMVANVSEMRLVSPDRHLDQRY